MSVQRALATKCGVARLVVAGIVVVCCWQSATRASAARLLAATIELDGQEVFASVYQDDGRADAAEVWSYLGQPPLFVERTPPAVADSADDLQTALEGAIVIRVEHGGRVIVEARTDALKLVRADAAGELWFLSEDELQRLARQNGILYDPTSVSPSQIIGLSVVILCGVAAVGAGVWLMLRTRQFGNAEHRP